MKVKSVFAGIFFVLLFSSCASVKQPESVAQPLNLSDSDIVALEVEAIKKRLLEEPVEALWRAIILDDKQLYNECADYVAVQMDKAIEENDYFEAKRYFVSLVNAGWKTDSSKQKSKSIEQLLEQDIPGIGVQSGKYPKTISECMNATVTIWVDRGVKITKGAGYADIIIGSGFFIDPRGYLITNHHVIDSMVNPKYEGFSRLYIKLLSDSDTKIPAKVIGYDPVLDFALLKVEVEPEFILSLGSSKSLHVGDSINAIGTPIGLEGTLTSGIISSIDRKLMTLGNVFQIDAAINSGNSGGPIIDKNMNVQAIVFAGMTRYQGLNFALPVEYLKQELPILYKGGELVHPWIAAYGHTFRNGIKKCGLEVQYVMPGGSAARSGLNPGDVIVSIDGNEISSIEDFQFLMMAYQPGMIVNCICKTETGETKNLKLYLSNRPKTPVVDIYNSDFISGSFIPIFGMELVNSSTLSKKSYKIKKIIKGSVADEMSFSEDDAVSVRDVKFDKENEVMYVQIYTQRKKKGLLDITMILRSPLDSPYYF